MDFYEYKGRKNAMIKFALIIAVIAGGASIFMMPYFAVPLACFALTLAFLSKEEQ